MCVSFFEESLLFFALFETLFSAKVNICIFILMLHYILKNKLDMHWAKVIRVPYKRCFLLFYPEDDAKICQVTTLLSSFFILDIVNILRYSHVLFSLSCPISVIPHFSVVLRFLYTSINSGGVVVKLLAC